MGSSGGGHGSGEVTYPDWFKLDAQSFLSNIETWITSGIGGTALEDDNPYEDVVAYDPTQRVGSMVASVRDFKNYVSGIDSLGAISAASQLADELVGDMKNLILPEDVDAAVQEFRRREGYGIDKALSILKSGYNSINAVNSSAFVLGQAMLLNELDRRATEFNAVMTIESKKYTLQYLLDVFKGALQMEISKNDLMKSVAAVEVDSTAKALVAEKEQHDSDVRLNAKERLYPLQLHAMWANAFAALGGGTGMSSQEWENATEKSGMFGWGTFLF